MKDFVQPDLDLTGYATTLWNAVPPNRGMFRSRGLMVAPRCRNSRCLSAAFDRSPSHVRRSELALVVIAKSMTRDAMHERVAWVEEG